MNVPKSYFTTPGVGIDIGGVGGIIVFHVMGKALSGKLSCTWTGIVILASSVSKDICCLIKLSFISIEC